MLLLLPSSISHPFHLPPPPCSSSHSIDHTRPSNCVHFLGKFRWKGLWFYTLTPQPQPRVLHFTDRLSPSYNTTLSLSVHTHALQRYKFSEIKSFAFTSISAGFRIHLLKTPTIQAVKVSPVITLHRTSDFNNAL